MKIQQLARDEKYVFTTCFKTSPKI